jgi:hypothetical protein
MPEYTVTVSRAVVRRPSATFRISSATAAGAIRAARLIEAGGVVNAGWDAGPGLVPTAMGPLEWEVEEAKEI